MTRRPTGGYDGPFPAPSSDDIPLPEERRWTLVRPAHHFTSRVVGQILVDNSIVGLVYLPDEAHFTWLQQLLEGGE